MLRLYVRKLITNDINMSFQVYKHVKFKHTQTVVPILLNIKTNPNFSHVKYKLLSKKIHTSASLKVRAFNDLENVYAHNILQTIPLVDKNLFTMKSPNKAVSTLEEFNSLLHQNWREKSAKEVVEGFKSALEYCKENNIAVSDKRFDKLVDGLMDRVQDLTDSELSELMICLSEYPPTDAYTSHNFHDIWSALDDVCCWRVGTWSNETLFLFAEHWYRLHLGKLSDFMFNFVEKMHKRAKFMTRNEIIHLYFYLKIHKRHKLGFECHDALDKYIESLSLQEIAIVAMVFARFETRMKLETTVKVIINKLKEELPSADEICVRRIVEALRYSSHVLLIDQLLDLLDHLVPEIDRLSNLCCIHIALLGTTLQFFHEKSLQKVSEKILNSLSNPNEVRLKDMERLLLALTMFNFTPKTDTDIFKSVFDEIHKEHRRKECVQYPRCLPSMLNFLSFRNIYSYELMDELLDKERYTEVYGKHPKQFSRDLFSLDVDIEIECPDYKGNRLDKSFRHRVAKWHTEYTPSWNQPKKITPADKFHLDVIDTVGKIVQGHQNLHTNHVLPNYVKSDIIICKNEKGNFVPPTGFETYNLGDVMRPLDRNLKWYAIVPINWNSAVRNTKQPLGLINKKCRQLRIIGYEPVLVIWNEFVDLNNADKIRFIKQKIT